MQAARSLAAVVLFLAAPAAAQKIDLSGLLGGPSPAGPSAGESAGPEKEIVLAAIREYTGPGSATALKTFAPMFGTRSKPDGTSEAFGEKHLQEAGKMLESLIRSGKIVVKPVQGGGVAGAWAPDIIDGKMTGGTFEVGDPKPVKKIGSNSRTYSDLFKQDQFANTMLHETGHMYYSAFTLGLGFSPQNQPAVPEEFRSFNFWNGTRPPVLCTGPDKCPYIHSKGPCRSFECYHWKITNHGYGQGNATEYAARVISQEMCDAESCAAYKRVLEPALR